MWSLVERSVFHYVTVQAACERGQGSVVRREPRKGKTPGDTTDAAAKRSLNYLSHTGLYSVAKPKGSRIINTIQHKGIEAAAGSRQVYTWQCL